jgi:hypothetical protein
MNIKQQTQNVANQGRYGDSMLLHVNPAEVKRLGTNNAYYSKSRNRTA